MTKRTLKIKYLKAHDFKTSLSTGVYGGVTTNGMINANFFTDRSVLPTFQTIEVDEKGRQLGPPVDERECDLMREVQFSAMMDLHTAKVIVAWLDSKVTELETLIANKS